MLETPILPARFESVAALDATPLERTYRARDAVLQREVLLKLPATAAAASWSAPVRARLLREARALAKIRHEAIAAIHWVEETAEGPLLVLDLPEGETLAERLARGPLEVDETIALGTAVASALAAVHYHGVVHRCVGPSSIRLLPDGSVRLGTFTFAKEYAGERQASSLVHDGHAAARAAAFLPDYSAPEQLAGQPADPRADVYALGCTLFRCLAGRDPFEPGQEHAPMPDLRRLRREVGKPLAEVVRRCTMHAKTARYATAQQVADALAKLGAAPSPAVARRAPWWALGSVATLVLAALLFRGWWSPNDDPAVTPIVGEDRRYDLRFGPDYARVHGLFVGIGQGYAGTAHRPLQNPVREVNAVAAQLRANDPQWARPDAITVLADGEATHERITKELERLVAEADVEDAVLLYFAGHGVRDGRSFGLCAADVAGTVVNGTGFLRRDDLGTYLDRLQAKHVLVVLDCCHSGAVFDLGPTRGRDPERGAGRDPAAHHRQRFSREFLCSAAATELAADGEAMSPFCERLLAQLRQPATAERPYVAARYLSSRIAEAMDGGVGHSGRMQVPRFRQMSEQEGSFVFRLGGGK